MKWKHVIAFICLVILASQMLPVKQIGALLSSNTINEELPHGLDEGKDPSKAGFAKNNIVLPHGVELSALLTNISREYFHFAVSLPDCHAGDIPTPPPNAA